MRRPPARSRTLALMALSLGALTWTARTPTRGQEARPPAASDQEAKLEERIKELDKAIGRHLEEGRIAEAIPPAREKLDLLARLRGKDHWQAGDARRDVDTYERLAARPRELQERFAEARRGAARADKFHGPGQYAQASDLRQ